MTDIPIDPPDIDTPVDRVAVIQALLQDVDHELREVGTPRERALLMLSVETLRAQMEVME